MPRMKDKQNVQRISFFLKKKQKNGSLPAILELFKQCRWHMRFGKQYNVLVQISVLLKVRNLTVHKIFWPEPNSQPDYGLHN